MAFENFLRQLGMWTTVQRWNEPILYRVRLKGDFLFRLLIAFGAGAAATCLLLVLFAINVKPPHFLFAFFGMLVVGTVALLLLLHGRNSAGGSVRICQEGICRKRHYAGLSAQWIENAHWPYEQIERCVIVPGESIGESFSLMFLVGGGEADMIGIPGRIDLPPLAQFLSTQGVAVERGAFVPQEFTRGMNVPLAALSATLGGMMLVGGLGFYLINVSLRRPAERDIVQRPDIGFEVPLPSRFHEAPAQDAEAQADAAPPVAPPAAPRVSTIPSAPPSSAVPAPFPSSIGHRELPCGTRTSLVGGSGGIAFETSNSRQQPVVGFRYSLGSWAGVQAVAQLQPLYAPEPAAADTVLARGGYVVSGLEVDAGELVHAVRIIFARQTAAGQLDTSDTYTSPWLGTPTNQSPKTLTGGTAYVIGLHGRRGAVIDALGLVLSSDAGQ